ncbi:predicted protein [Ostreococcus lucimarinus CCE9901]|uniref:Uncharacterized protein n=1 Tax=Ostreococcus lucimarinus (strain CCE9901) TaxID=436017 RepID=A4S5Y4_OSTLU|nr:predicted protein [Ostreococcus lucimarinus CCE9901]ABO99145.1 predicted protein [Ostreococcus lucimarinus CCE9901]|eukprot:XP_001420852.1 predicted protein [Ostreococcus lucimarinus CCE9901]
MSWIPLDPIINELSNVLTSGELVHDANFSLFDAMSALDIGDLKMDAGAVRDGSRLTLAQLLASGRAPKDITGRDLVRELDAMLCAEGTFRKGYAAATTVWTNAHCAGHRTGHLDDATPALRAFTRATLASASMAQHAVKTGDVYEEEDFAVLGDFGEVAGREAWATAEADDEVLIELASALMKMEDSGGDRDVEAVVARLEFRRAHHLMMKTLTGAIGAGTDARNEARQHANAAKARLKEMRNYYSEDVVDDEDALDWDPNAGSFSKGLSLHMLGGAPPREVHFLSTRRAFEYFEREIDDVLVAAEVFKFRARKEAPTIEEVLECLERLQTRRPGAIALGLAAAELMHEKELCGWHFGHVGLHSVWTFAGVTTKTLETSFAHPKDAVDAFIDECVQPLTVVVRSFCVNRARFRRVLRRSLGEFSHLQIAADALDAAQDDALATSDEDRAKVETLRSLQAPCIAWAEHLTCYVELRHLELGFSLDLYLPHELAMVYYYMHYLQRLRVVTLRRKAMTPSTQTIQTQLCFLAEQQKLSMYSALRFTFAALLDSGKLRPCVTAFSGEDLRFWQRFSTFQTVELPPPAHYDDYKASIEANLSHFRGELTDADEAVSDVTVFAGIADRFFQEARTAADFVTEKFEPHAASDAVVASLVADVVASRVISTKNLVALRLLFATDMTCACDTKSHDLYAQITACKP